MLAWQGIWAVHALHTLLGGVYRQLSTSPLGVAYGNSVNVTRLGAVES